MSHTNERLPFLFGAQYYRAPTPAAACWAADLHRMRELGFNSVKYWVQWRWSHRQAERFSFDDLDQLMDLAQANGLAVTLNIIFDVAPHWLYTRYPDAKQIRNDGRVIEPSAPAHRQIGGSPGPCYNHPGARVEREAFLAATVVHFKAHPALSMWDVWNEPELSFPQRAPNIDTLVCYCAHCVAQFRLWVQEKYRDLPRLNQVWGRCYEDWSEVEAPRVTEAISDFVDWREFHIYTMSAEGRWRIEAVRQHDPEHTCYLHVAPNVMTCWNSVTCSTDDFALAEPCDIFAASFNDGPAYAPQVLSAAKGKLCYNVETHLNYGNTALHQRMLDLDDVRRALLPQIGMGFRGFQFWQFRAESLGWEAPAWGLVHLDGSDRPVTQAVAAFWRALQPYTPALLDSPPSASAIGLWKSRKNEVFHFAIHGSLKPLIESVDPYMQMLYWENYPFRIVSDTCLARGDLAGLRLLIMPSCYYLTEEEARSLDAWVRAGGVLLAEAHLGGYNGSSGRHSATMPGCGLAQAWGLYEGESTASYHLRLSDAEGFTGSASDDVKRAWADMGSRGGKYLPVQLAGGALAWGAERYATFAGAALTVEGRFADVHPCFVSTSVESGVVFCAGTNFGQGAAKDATGLREILRLVSERAGLMPLCIKHDPAAQLHVDMLQPAAGPRFVSIVNHSSTPQAVHIAGAGSFTGLFSGSALQLGQPTSIPGESADLFVERMHA